MARIGGIGAGVAAFSPRLLDPSKWIFFAPKTKGPNKRTAVPQS